MSECTKCLEILELMLDKETDGDQEEFFSSHIENCIPCLNHYELEQKIKDYIKSKITSRPIPDGLAEEIRSQIVRLT